MNNMSMQSGPGRGYKYLRTEALWPFGAGLPGYTSFTIRFAPPTRKLIRGRFSPTDSVPISVICTNVGRRVGSNVLIVFASRLGDVPTGYSVTPLKWMVAFNRTGEIPAAGGVVNMPISFNSTELKMVNDKGDEVVLAGSFNITVADGTNSISTTISVSKTLVLSSVPQPPEM